MSVTGQNGDVLHWQRKLLSADDLRRHLNGHHALVLSPGTLITPLALDELRAKGIQISRIQGTSAPAACRLAFAQEVPHPMVHAAIKGTPFTELPRGNDDLKTWIHGLAAKINPTDYQALALFCVDAAHAACLANKHENIRAAVVYVVPHAVRALKTFAANFLAVEMPGRTYFEIRQIFAALTKEAAHAHR